MLQRRLFRNVNSREMKDLVTLVPILNRCSFFMIPDTRIWFLKGSEEFSCKSFMYHIGNPCLLAILLDTFIWKAKIPFKVKAFVWTVVLQRMNANDLLQRCRPNKVLSPNVCALSFLVIMCVRFV